MPFLLPSFLLAVFACWFAGLAVYRPRHPTSLADLGWLGIAGICTLTFAGMLINLAFPLQPLGTILIPLAALAALGILRSVFRNQRSVADPDSLKIKHSPLNIRNFSAFQLFSISAFSLLSLLFASRPIQHGDTGLYHLQAMLWMSESALPAGLANLHFRFGFNSAWWCFAALFNFPFQPRGSGMFFPVALLGLFSGLILCCAIPRLLQGKGRVVDWFVLPGMYLWLRQIVGDNNPSLSTDAPVNLLVLLSALALLRWMESASRDTSWLLLCSLTAATAASIKLTGYPWLAASTLLVLFLLAFQRPDTRNQRTENKDQNPLNLKYSPLSISYFSAFQLFSFSAFIILLDLIRGILISGYPLFPSSFAGLHALPWAVVPQFLGGATDGIRSWPTRDTAGSGFFEFLRIWIENQFGFANITFATIMLIGLFGAALLVLIVNGPDRCWKILRPRLLLWIVLLVSLLVCFSYAPALRFVSGYFFALAGLTLGVLICMLPGNWSQHIGKPLTLIMILAAFAANIPGMISRPIELVGIPELPIPQLEIRSTMQGENLLIAIDSFPWAAPLPVSSHFDPDIQIQRSTTGKIQMIHMPKKN